ncbi:MAG: DUF2779 domain-containing protein [Myxococcota bacterium]
MAGESSSSGSERSGSASSRLSKSKYLAGLQCERRVWLQSHDDALASEWSAATQAILDAGTEVGTRARELFPGGELVDEPPWEHAQAVARTQRLVAEASRPAIFEAAFEHAGVRIRVDVLERLSSGRWGLREVKSSGSVKVQHLDDLAVQHFVLTGAGLDVVSSELIHVNTSYERGPDGIDWERYFVRVECSKDIQERLVDVPERVHSLLAVLSEPTPPEVAPDRHCKNPHECEFWAHCTRDKPEDWVFHLPRMSQDRYQDLVRQGQERISELPADVDLTPVQERVRDVVQSGEPFVSSTLQAALADAGPPAWYLDFETTNPAIPQFEGTRPYQMIPFQWSLHRVDVDASLTHAEFLAEGHEDPRPAFCESLLAALPDDGAAIHVYSRFEATRLRELAEEFPSHAPGLDRIRGRLFDELEVVRRDVYHGDFGCSFSIKSVAPALAPGFGWDDLGEVSEGSEAPVAWNRLASGEAGPGETARLREALLAYCKRDTLAMVKLHEGLTKLAGYCE